MKALFLVIEKQRALLDSLYDSICHHLGDCDLRRPSRIEQKNLKKYFQDVDIGSYDRIILFIYYKYQFRQSRFIRTLPNLVLLEHDATQNYLHNSRHYRKFSRYYRKLPWAKVIVSGIYTRDRLITEGVDACYVPKGYDGRMLYNKHGHRDVELGFIGSLKDKDGVYQFRREFLQQIERTEGLVIIDASKIALPGEEYCNALNRMQIFVNADIGFHEYMIKNFEAMACGCLLLTWDQGEKENTALGFRDMENVVLYQSKEEFQEKLKILRNDPGLRTQIADAGQMWAENHLSWETVGSKAAEIIKKPLRKKRKQHFCGFTFYSAEEPVSRQNNS